MLEATKDVPHGGPAPEATASGEDARRPQKGAPGGSAASGQSLVVRVGTRFTTVFRFVAGRPMASRMFSHGPVVLAASHAAAASANGSAAARVMRLAAQQVAEQAGLEGLNAIKSPVLGAASVARAVITLGAAGGSRATVRQIHGATDTLANTWVDARKGGLSHQGVESIMIGSAVIGAILDFLCASEIAVEGESSGEDTVEREGTLEMD